MALALLALVACDEPGRTDTGPGVVAPTIATPTPVPDIRATVVAEITATAVAQASATPTPAETPDALPLPAETPTLTATVTQTPLATLTATATHTPLPAGTPTATATHTATPSPSATPAPTSTPTPEPTPTPTQTPVPTVRLVIDGQTNVLGYWSDGTADVEMNVSLSNMGDLAAEKVQSVRLRCDGDLSPDSGCGKEISLELQDGYGPGNAPFQLRLPMGSTSVELLYGDNETEDCGR